jgi:DNA primase
MFPVSDLQGRTIAFGGRIIAAGEPKYLNSSDSPLFHKSEVLYAIDKAKAHITATGTAIVVEGYTDTIAMHEAGFTHTVATLGTALTQAHLKLLNRFAKKVIYLFDGDKAGREAARRAAALINRDITPEAGSYRFLLEVAELPAGLDPAELLAGEGAGAMQTVLDASIPLLRYALERSLDDANLSTPEGRNAALRAALTVLLPIRGSLLASEYLADFLAPRLGVDYAAAQALLTSLPAPRESSREPATSASEASAGAFAQGASAPGSSGASSPDNSSASDAAASSPAPAGDTKMEGLRIELLTLYIEYPETRPLLAKAFERIAWEDAELASIAEGLGQAAADATPEELYALALALAPHRAALLSAGLTQGFAGAPKDHARLVMYMLYDLQLQNEIALARIEWARLGSGPRADELFSKIAAKQSELATNRERLAEIPKTLP